MATDHPAKLIDDSRADCESDDGGAVTRIGQLVIDGLAIDSDGRLFQLHVLCFEEWN